MTTSTPDIGGSWVDTVSETTGLSKQDVDFAIDSTKNAVVAFAAGGLISKLLGGNFIKGGMLAMAIRGVWDAFEYCMTRDKPALATAPAAKHT